MEEVYVLEVNGLGKRYSEEFYMDNVTFNIEKGDIIGLIGPNGAGKSTIIKSILDIVKKDKGTIKFKGMNIDEDFYGLYREDIGYVGEGTDYFSESKLVDISKFYKQFYTKWDDLHFNELIQKFDLNLNVKMKNLSKGMKVKFSLALCLSHYPSLLILDEPTSGLDPLIRFEVLNILKDYVEKQNASILFSSHIIEDLEIIADNLIFIKGGKIIEIISVDDLHKREGSIETYIRSNF